MPIVRQKMIEFVNSGGLTAQGQKGIYIKNNPTLKPAANGPSSEAHEFFSSQ
jgi:hypothetical protein